MVENLFIGINSKYIHTNLAIRYFKQHCNSEGINAEIYESTINNSIDSVLRDIVELIPKRCFFSVYIWNVEFVLKLIKNIKSINPEIEILLGGPEVSYNYENLLQNYPIDMIIIGEGEISINRLLKGEPIDEIVGLAYKKDSKIVETGTWGEVIDMNSLLFPYEDFIKVENKILYYESSRGCPYNCEYCISSTVAGVRFKNIQSVIKDLDIFISGMVKQVKFIDRTFNADLNRSISILKYIIDNDKGITNFHFEITANLINDEFVDVLSSAREGLFQFEIGVQSTNTETLSGINRILTFEKISKNIKRILNETKCHIHLDLIAGLPHENFESFKKSFNDVMKLRPDMIQLGFLKLLHGSKLRNDKDRYGYIFREYPPYEVISNNSINFSEINVLKDIDEIGDSLYNNHKFEESLKLCLKKDEDAFDVFYKISNIIKQSDKDNLNVLDYYEKLYEYMILMNFSADIASNIIKFDYVTNFEKKLLDFMPQNKEDKPFLHDYIRNNFDEIKSKFNLTDSTVKEIIKKIKIENFTIDVHELIENGKIVYEEVLYIFINSKNSKHQKHTFNYIKVKNR